MTVTARDTPTRSGLRQAHDLSELFGVAMAIAGAAAARYALLARMFGNHRNRQVADLLRTFAENQRAIAATVHDYARSAGATPHSPEGFDWVEREGLPMAAVVDAGGPWLMTPLGAVALAAELERRVFDYFSEMSADPAAAAVRAWAERLGKESLGRLVELRLARRRAHRAEYRPEPRIRTIAQLRATAGAIETEASRETNALALQLESLTRADDAALLHSIARQIATAAAGLLSAGESGSATAVAWRAARPVDDAEPQDAVAVLRAALILTEQRFQLYTRIAELATDEETGEAGRLLAEQAVRQLADISARLSAAFYDT